MDTHFFESKLGVKVQALIDNLKRELYRRLLAEEELNQTNRFLTRKNQENQIKCQKMQKQLQSKENLIHELREQLAQTRAQSNERLREVTAKLEHARRQVQLRDKKTKVACEKQKVEAWLGQFRRFETAHARVAAIARQIKSVKRKVKRAIKCFRQKLSDWRNEQKFLRKYIDTLNGMLGASRESTRDAHDLLDRDSDTRSGDRVKPKKTVRLDEGKWHNKEVPKRPYKLMNFDEIMEIGRKEVETKPRIKTDKISHSTDSIGPAEMRGIGPSTNMRERWLKIQSKISHFID